ncbi:class I SAM-dependent methyltransferase [Candidatus Woesearchaeota archaeon]|nr:class I SAM-dependent methyltransferase [Candidatus Woesearchaeota archaeon]
MSHYYDEEQDGSLREQTVAFSVLGRRFSAVTGSGVFSKGGLDNATRVLVESCSLRGTEECLDLGCGWGAVGLVLKEAHPDISLVMSDVNTRAVRLARKNVPGADVRLSNGFSNVPESFDMILTNPPYAAGREVCYRLIEESFGHLRPRGRFLLVVRYRKGGKMLEQKIKDVFGDVEVLKKSGGFRVYQGVR